MNGLSGQKIDFEQEMHDTKVNYSSSINCTCMKMNKQYSHIFIKSKFFDLSSAENISNAEIKLVLTQISIVDSAIPQCVLHQIHEVVTQLESIQFSQQTQLLVLDICRSFPNYIPCWQRGLQQRPASYL